MRWLLDKRDAVNIDSQPPLLVFIKKIIPSRRGLFYLFIGIWIFFSMIACSGVNNVNSLWIH